MRFRPSLCDIAANANHAAQAINGTSVEITDMMMRLPKYDLTELRDTLPVELAELHDAMADVREKFWSLEAAIQKAKAEAA